MEEHEYIEHYVKMVGQPERLEGITASILYSKYEYDDCNKSEDESRKSCHSQEQPVRELGQEMAPEIHFSKEASQIAWRLRGNVIEVNPVTNAVHDSGEESCHRYNLVEANVGIKWDIIIEDGLTKIREEVSSHRNEKNRISPHHTRGSSTCNRHTITSNSSQSTKLSLHRIVISSLYKDPGRYKEEHGEVEDVKLVILHPT